MPANFSYRNPNYIPRPTKHARGQAVVRLNGKDVYLGQWGSPAADAKYDRVVLEWLAQGRQLPGDEDDRKVEDLVLAFWRHAEKHYRHPTGRPTSELHCQKTALRQLRTLYGDMDADAFGPSELRIVRDGMIKLGWARKAINIHLSRIRHVFRWGGEHGIVAPEVYHKLLCVRGLQVGRSDARETEPVKPAAEDMVNKTLPHVSRHVAAMVQLQLLTGMRSGEVTIMRACDIDMTGKVWVYRPEHHKTAWHGKGREIFLGPQAQTIIKPFFRLNTQGYLFNASEAEAERIVELRRNRKSKVQPSQVCRKRKNAKRKPGARYTTVSYGRAIRRGCEKAFPPPKESKGNDVELKKWRKAHNWHPHQLRHNAATKLRKEYGIETARVILGHSSAAVTEVYAEQDRQRAVEVMAKVG